MVFLLFLSIVFNRLLRCALWALRRINLFLIIYGDLLAIYTGVSFVNVALFSPEFCVDAMVALFALGDFIIVEAHCSVVDVQSRYQSR
jgi:hypothetical protein